MRIAVIIDLDESQMDDGELRYPVIADLLRMHAHDVELTEGSAPLIGGRVAYGTHVISHRIIRTDGEGDPPTFRSEDIPEFIRQRNERWARPKGEVQ